MVYSFPVHRTEWSSFSESSLCKFSINTASLRRHFAWNTNKAISPCIINFIPPGNFQAQTEDCRQKACRTEDVQVSNGPLCHLSFQCLMMEAGTVSEPLDIKAMCTWPKVTYCNRVQVKSSCLLYIIYIFLNLTSDGFSYTTWFNIVWWWRRTPTFRRDMLLLSSRMNG